MSFPVMVVIQYYHNPNIDHRVLRNYMDHVEHAGTPYLFCATRPYRLNLQSMVYCITTTGSILDSAVWPVGGLGPDYGAAGLAFDGEYLWGIHNDGGPIENLALQMRYITDIGVKPASVGRIKALYR